MTTLVVIPARWGSTRLPGKPLISIAGRPLLARVVDLVQIAVRDLSDVQLAIATDDERIAALGTALGVRSIMTDPGLSSGSARALAAAAAWDLAPDTIVNVQGDAPFIPPEAVAAVIGALSAGAAVATPVCQLNWAELDALRLHKQRAPFSGTTCIVGGDGNALWFSKQVIPALRDEPTLRAAASVSPILQHLGLYGYALAALKRFEAAAPSFYEILEGLEQLRFVEIGIPICTVEVACPAMMAGGIDTLEDVRRAERLIELHGELPRP